MSIQEMEILDQDIIDAHIDGMIYRAEKTEKEE